MNYDRFGNFLKKNFSTPETEKNFYLRYISTFSLNKVGKKKEKTKINIESFLNEKKMIPKTIYGKNDLIEKILFNSKKTRNISIVGHHNHGKSSLVNCLASSVHLSNEKDLFKRFSDFSFWENQRECTLRISITTLLICDKKGKLYPLGLIDCPGHPEFLDQTITSMNFSEGSILVLDISEGVLLGTELSLRYLIYMDLPVILLINALDRLILEFGFSPRKIQKRIFQILDELNSIIEENYPIYEKRKDYRLRFFNPIDGNVCFGSLIQGWTFTIDQFSEMYLSSQPSICLSHKDLTERIWKNDLPFLYSFKNSQKIDPGVSTFEKFILIPLFKIIFFNLGESALHLRKFLENELGIFGINKDQLIGGFEDNIKLCMTFFFGGCRKTRIFPNHTGLLSEIVRHFPSFKKTKLVPKNFKEIFKKLFSLGFIWKISPSVEKKGFLGVTKILKGKFQPGVSVCVVTEGHSLYWDQKYRSVCSIKNILLPIGSYFLNLNQASAGSIVLIQNLDQFTKKSSIFSDLKSGISEIQQILFSTMKSFWQMERANTISIFIGENSLPQNKRLYQEIRILCRLNSKLNCQIREGGEMILTGPGILFLSHIVFELKKNFKEVQFKISDPGLIFRETLSLDNKQFFFSEILKFQLKNYEIRDIDTDIRIGIGIDRFYLGKPFGFKSSLKKAIMAGYICKNLQDSKKTNKFEANSIWAFGFQFPKFSCCRLKTSFKRVKISRKQKKIIIETFFWTLIRGCIHGEILNGIIFEFDFPQKWKQEGEKNYQFWINLKKFFQKILSENKPEKEEPWFLGEIKILHRYFSLVSKLIEKKNGFLSSLKFIKEKNEVLINFFIPSSPLFELEKNLENLTQRKIHCFLFFDSWKSLNQRERD